MSIFDDIEIEGEEEEISCDPIEIFNSLTLRGNIENIWTHQEKALNSWHASRSKEHTLIKLNTGTGKTLIGLMMAQSMINETNGKVLYVCPNNQLIEQTYNKCKELGLKASTYYNGKWRNKKHFDQNSGVIITNYSAVFNGKSIFQKYDIDGIILDDSHVAYQVLRDCFTIRITDEEARDSIIELYREHFESSSMSYKYQEIKDSIADSPLFVPLFASIPKSKELKKILSTQIGDDGGGHKGNIFSWVHLKNHLNLCSIFISNQGVEISPINLPLSKFNFMGESTRKVYLTATMPTNIEFTRSFGISKNINTIEPEGKLSDAQRLFLFPTEKKTPEDFIEKYFEEYNVCIITNSSATAKKWEDSNEEIMKFEKGDGQEKIDDFMNSEEVERLLLKARYDGIDLPGQSCSVLALDGLPSGSSLYDSFFDQVIKIENIRKSLTSTRVTQSIGRIFRSNTDHGIVVIFDSKYQEWIKDPKNISLLPELLQKQVKLSIQINESGIEDPTKLKDLIENFFESTSEWDDFYKKNLKKFSSSNSVENGGNLIEAYSKEYELFNKLWDGNNTIQEEYINLATSISASDRGLSAWYRHIAGSYLQESCTDSQARIQLNIAADFCSALGRLPLQMSNETVTSIIPSRQANLILKCLKDKKEHIKFLDKIHDHLKYGKEKEITEKAEQAVIKIGNLLGLNAKLIDNGEANTGPDVIWLNDNNEGASIELKTGKATNGIYRKKDDIGQYFDHIEWLNNNYSDVTFYYSIIGRKLRVASEANPPKMLRIITLDSFYELVKRMLNFFEMHDSTSKPGTIEVNLMNSGLKWPNCISSLSYFLAEDLKNHANFNDINELID